MAMTLPHFHCRYAMWHYIQNKKREDSGSKMYTIKRPELETHDLLL